jgi:hypothetical protein
MNNKNLKWTNVILRTNLIFVSSSTKQVMRERNAIVTTGDERIKIIACHAGTGKTTLAKRNPEKFIDFVCMPYKYYLPKKFNENESEACKANLDHAMREDYPQNYFEAIQKTLKECVQTLLVAPDWRFLDLLRREGIPYLLCYPENTEDAKESYRKRYTDRGNTEDFIDIFINRWECFMDFFENDRYGSHIILKPDQYLSDVL